MAKPETKPITHRLQVALKWNAELGEAWMNPDNLATLLYTAAATKANLLGFEVVEKDEPAGEASAAPKNPGCRAVLDDPAADDCAIYRGSGFAADRSEWCASCVAFYEVVIRPRRPAASPVATCWRAKTTASPGST